MPTANNIYEDDSDEKLMWLFQNEGNSAVFEVIYQRYFQTLYKYIIWISGSSTQAEDIAQNILVKLYHKPTLFDPDKNLKVWLFVTAKNQVKNEHRNTSTRSAHLEIIKSTTNSIQEDHQSANNTRLQQIQNSIQQLSEDHREVITLKYSNNLTIKEISQVLDCSEGTVKSRLFYAIKKMKTQILANKIYE